MPKDGTVHELTSNVCDDFEPSGVEKEFLKEF